MKANELRIGNWINTDGDGEEQVVDVLCDSVNTKTYEGISYDMIDPIPLTEEWLLKFGFEKRERYVNWPDSDKKLPVWALFSFSLSIREDGRLFYDWIGGNIEVKYVHRLQNLYFALTGTELEIK